MPLRIVRKADGWQGQTRILLLEVELVRGGQFQSQGRSLPLLAGKPSPPRASIEPSILIEKIAQPIASHPPLTLALATPGEPVGSG
jgi:hypothetical protein